MIRSMVDEVLRRLASDSEKLYSHMGRPSIPPEQLLRALLLQLFFMGHVVMENRNGLAVGVRLTHATGKAEREAALELLVRSTPAQDHSQCGFYETSPWRPNEEAADDQLVPGRVASTIT